MMFPIRDWEPDYVKLRKFSSDVGVAPSTNIECVLVVGDQKNLHVKSLEIPGLMQANFLEHQHLLTN